MGCLYSEIAYNFQFWGHTTRPCTDGVKCGLKEESTFAPNFTPIGATRRVAPVGKKNPQNRPCHLYAGVCTSCAHPAGRNFSFKSN